MRNPLWLAGPLAALLLSACSGGAGGKSGSMNPPTTGESNTAPAITGLAANQSVLQDGSSDPIGFQVGDAQTATAQLNVTASSSNESLMPAAGIELSGDGANRSVLLTPEPGQSGTADITLSVKDAAGMSTTRKLTLTVTAQQKSFRDFAIASLNSPPDAQPAEVAGHAWVDIEEDNPTAFDGVLSSIAE